MPKKIYKLCVSYDEAGAELRQHLADRIKLLGMDGTPVWQASFRDMQADDLPPGDGVVQIYPVFMQSGWTVTEAPCMRNAACLRNSNSSRCGELGKT